MQVTVERESVLDATRAIRPVIERNRFVADEQAKMVPEVLAATRDAGVYTLMAPREVGGAEASFPEIVAVFEELGYADPTVAWHAGNSVGVPISAYYMQESARDLVFAAPHGPYGFAGVPGGVAVPVDGGYRLTGRWPFLTGALDAPWSYLTGIVHENGAPRMRGPMPDLRGFILPARDITIVEGQWQDASAMRGTGSHPVSVEDVFVPEQLAISLDPALIPVLDRPNTYLPGGAGSPVTNAAIAVGIARKALDYATDVLAGRISEFDGTAYRDRIGMQQKIAEAHGGVESLSGGMRVMAEHVWNHTVAGTADEAVKARMWATMLFTLDRARELVSALLTISTSRVYIKRNPIETGLRDLHAICASMEAMRPAQEAAGRVFLGLAPEHPMFARRHASPPAK